jgi:hypothetical protein
MELILNQSWERDPEFRPGRAVFSWSEGHLHLRAEFRGGGANTTATRHGERLWEIGDVAELFIQRCGENAYREYQVAPNGLTLALFYPDLSGVADLRRGHRRMEEFLTGEIPSAAVSVDSEGWSVALSVPLSASPGETFRLSCCRYDHGMGAMPVLSSTSPHPVRDFHRPQDWREFVPMAG